MRGVKKPEKKKAKCDSGEISAGVLQLALRCKIDRAG